MLLTIISTTMLMLAYFLLLYGGVAFIQDKRFFSSAPKEIRDVVPERKERFRGAHMIGWFLIVIAILTFIGAFVLGAWNGIRNDFSFLEFFGRFLIMLFGMEIFDIVIFDWVLLCHSGFYTRFYPEVKDIVGPHLFGFNKKEHMIHFIIYIPICMAIAFVCILI